jgi:mannose/cellobiose epimerase-like protein (N-acyl-D-glucosamine 2-epimerase family)
MIPYLIRHIRNPMRGRWTSVIAARNSSQETLTVHMQNGEFNDNG